MALPVRAGGPDLGRGAMPVEAGLGTDIEAPIRQNRHDLTWLQCDEFRLVADEWDPLAFLIAEAVRHMAVAGLTPIHAAIVSSELPAPTLRRDKPYPDKQANAAFAPGATAASRISKALRRSAAVVRPQRPCAVGLDHCV